VTVGAITVGGGVIEGSALPLQALKAMVKTESSKHARENPFTMRAAPGLIEMIFIAIS
jgi:hypothetical protein